MSLHAGGGQGTEQSHTGRTNALIIFGAAKPVLAGEHPAHSLGTSHLHPFQVPVIAELRLRLAHLAAGMTGHTASIHASIPKDQPQESSIRQLVTLFTQCLCQAGYAPVLTPGQRHKLPTKVYNALGGARINHKAALFLDFTCCTKTLRRVPRASPTSSS